MLPIPGAHLQIQQHFARILASDAANVVTATLLWRSVTGLPADYDANDETTLGDAVVSDHSLDFRSFFHQVDHRLSGFQRNLEIQTGDIMLDYLADLDLGAKRDLRVRIKGEIYVQKSIGTALKEAWDVQLGLGGTLRTLLLTPAG
jgi:hypothetical protein